MRIVLIGPVYPYRGGIAHHTALLERALRASNHEVLVISFQRQYPRWLYPGSSDQDPSKVPLHTSAEFLLDPIYPWTWRQTIKRIIFFKPDIVAIQWWTTFWAFPFTYLSGTLRRSQIPTTYLIHNVLPHEAHIWDRWLARLALSQAKRMIAQAPNERDRLLKLLPSSRVSLCLMPLFSRFSNNNISKSDARRKLNLTDKTHILLFFGIIRPYKGLHILLDALAILQKRGTTPYLIIAGEFWEDKEVYIKQADQLHLTKQVKFDDRYIVNEDAEVYFAATDVLVAPYIGGTQSAAAALALGYGLPVITTEHIATGIEENYQKYIFEIPSGDSEALAKTIQDCLERLIPIEKTITNDQGEWGKIVDAIVELGTTDHENSAFQKSNKCNPY